MLIACSGTCMYVQPQRERVYYCDVFFAAEPRVVGLAPPKTDQTAAVSVDGGVGRVKWEGGVGKWIGEGGVGKWSGRVE